MSEIHLSCYRPSFMSSSRILTTMSNKTKSLPKPPVSCVKNRFKTTRNILFPSNRDRVIAMDSFETVRKTSRYYRGREEWWSLRSDGEGLIKDLERKPDKSSEAGTSLESKSSHILSRCSKKRIYHIAFICTRTYCFKVSTAFAFICSPLPELTSSSLRLMYKWNCCLFRTQRKQYPQFSPIT